jgi:hypothetical protein
MMRFRRTIVFAALASALVAATAAASWIADQGHVQLKLAPHWTEIAWPFPMDEWGTGKAYRCEAAACGHEIEVYLRGKLGFCNCTTGVADDAELDRLSDFQLVGGRAKPIDQGRPVRVAWMNGRSRAFALPGFISHKALMSIAFSNECDALVATAVFEQDVAASAEPQVLAFLNSVTVERWAKAELGR